MFRYSKPSHFQLPYLSILKPDLQVFVTNSSSISLLPSYPSQSLTSLSVRLASRLLPRSWSTVPSPSTTSSPSSSARATPPQASSRVATPNTHHRDDPLNILSLSRRSEAGSLKSQLSCPSEHRPQGSTRNVYRPMKIYIP